MNSKNTHNSISNNRSLTEVSRKDAVTTTESRPIPDDEPTATNSTYESFSWLFSYLKMYATRLARDLYTSLKIYWYPNREFLPNHIVNLMQVQKRLRAERESLTVTYSRYKLINHSGVKSAFECSTQTVSLVAENNSNLTHQTLT